MNDDKVSLFVSLIAYTQGSWTPEEVIKAYEFIQKEAIKPVASNSVRLVPSNIAKDGESRH
jgi:hypothetical protein